MDALTAALLHEMRDEAGLALDLVTRHEVRSIVEDPWLSRGLALSFLVIGEASARTSQELKRANPHVAWDDAKALRNRIAHGYRSVIPETLVVTAREHLPKLIADIDRILAEEPPP